MRDLKNKLTSGKNTKNIQTRKGKSFGYQVLGFGAGGSTTFIVATGGTITTSGDCKIHTFTGDATFAVTCAGSPSNNIIAYMVSAGGGGSGGNAFHIAGGGGGGAGGFREGRCATMTPYTASPRVVTGVTASVASFPIVVGGGGQGGKGFGPSLPGTPTAGSGSESSALGITSTGGGRGGQPNSSPAPLTFVKGAPGGSGGGTGGGNSSPAGGGNDPVISPQPQGSPGGVGSTSSQTLGGSGGGATGAGSTAPGCSPPPSAPGRGAGATTSINASPTLYSRGGAYSHYNPSGFNPIGPAPANSGNGADAQNAAPAPNVPQTASNYDGLTGGSGIVIIRYKFQQEVVMAHFAKITEENEVLAIHVVNNSDILNADNVEDETVGQAYLEQHSNWPAHLWIQTSYNTYGGKHYTTTHDSEGNQTRSESTDQTKAFRGNYAGIGYTWNEDDQIFWPKKLYASWVKNNLESTWQSPIGNAPELTAEQISQNEAGTHLWIYKWDETNTTWDLTDYRA